MGLLPVFWEGEGEDRTEALEWLRGTDTEVDLRRRKEQGISLVSDAREGDITCLALDSDDTLAYSKPSVNRKADKS